MKNINIKAAIYLLIGISFLIFYGIYWVQDMSTYNIKTVLIILPKVISIDLFLYALFSAYFWRLLIFKDWLVPFPNLNGTWKGFIYSTWKDPITGQRPSPIPAILTIKQSFLNISCVMRTKEMTSSSITSGYMINKDIQLNRLFYTYASEPIQTVRERSPIHYGTIHFDIIKNPKNKLEGGYWTDRKTTGEIKMTFWKTEKLDCFPKDLGTHPVGEIRNNKS